ncbi:MAG: hypothetical protein ACREC1_02410 [Methylovirgula sp.]
MQARNFLKVRIKSFLFAAAAIAIPAFASVAAEGGFLNALQRQTMLVSTIPDNGDVNPYAVVVAPLSIGKIKKGDVLVDNFNDRNNLQGLGTTIVDYSADTKAVTLFASVPRHLAQCPGGVGLTTAMAMLRSGYVIVGSLPSDDGTMKTGGQGCLIVFDSNDKFVEALADAKINGPWGNMAVVDHGSSATLFVSNIGAGARPSGGSNHATVVRFELAIAKGPPTIKSETVIGSGFSEMPDKDVFVIGPTGLVLDKNGTLYVSNALGNSINAIPQALTRKDSAGTGTVITKGGMLKRPLAMTLAPNGNLIVANAQNGEVVEVNPSTHEQVAARWVNVDKAQSPPGSGDLFGIALTLDGKGFYYVNDDVNELALAH